MNVRFLKTSLGWKNSCIFCLVAIFTGLFSLRQQCFAQMSLLQPVQPNMFVNPSRQLNWISGPQKLSLGTLADFNIPQGYRLTDAAGARFILENNGIAVPKDIIGLLTDDKSTAIIEYSPKGYVKSADIAQINPATVLKDVQERIQVQNDSKQVMSSIKSLNWQSVPAYDSPTHSFAWSLQVQTASSRELNETVVLLGRHGILQITSILSYPLGNSPPLKQLVESNIAFKDGERYTDYQSGDKVAEIGLADIIAGPKPKSSLFAGGFGAVAAWTYSGLAVCLVLGGVLIVHRNKRQPRRASVRAPVMANASSAHASATNAVAAEPALALNNHKLNGNGNGHHTPVKVSPAQKRESKQFNRNRRKRVFDYPKFYTNVMRELSLHSYGPGGVATNGKSHANGHSNGHANGTNGSKANETIKSEIVELIATQKNLIQEQKCLLEQQTRLIEEKRWLIEEQTAFLKGQSSLIDEQQYPLKFKQ